MYSFACDYLEGAHPLILKALTDTNFEQTPGYGADVYCERARDKIRKEAGCPEAGVHFLVGGTQTNSAAIALVLKPWEGVIAADSGHIAVHETGAIEASGHKVLTLPATDGKIDAKQIDDLCSAHFGSTMREHTVKPGMVYISQPTELGTLYSLGELEAISKVCKKWGIKLFVDGARLIYALAAPENDVELKDLSRLCDLYYIGGTKAGCLFGEALIINDAALDGEFRYLQKQRGALLAKGRLLGLQFDTLFTDGLYKQIGAHAVAVAHKIRAALSEAGVRERVVSPTNQLFPIITAEEAEVLSRNFVLESWESLPEGEVKRICTSWATGEDAADALIKEIKKMRRI